MELHVIIVAFHRAVPLRIIMDCFLVQSNTHWILHIIHDGPCPADIRAVLDLPQYQDPRIFFEETPVVNGNYGHPNRQYALKKLALNHRDCVLITNDDNYYVPRFVEFILAEFKKNNVGFVYCDTIHSYYDYNVLFTEVKENHIDMGSFVVKLDIARRVGFNYTHLSADGRYAEQCANYCRVRRLKVVHIPKALFVHN